MRRSFFVRVVCAALVALVASAGVAFAVGRFSTVDQTILDRDGDNRLEPAPGDDYQQRAELGAPREGRDKFSKRQSLAFFGQLTDQHVIDEESPARVEFLDKFGPPFTSAYRPQEGITPQVANEMVREMRNSISEVTNNDIDFTIVTGDNSDNTQCNETRWYIDILDGGANGDVEAQVPGGGKAKNCVPQDLRPASKRIDPNSGLENTCEPPDGKLYDGVRDQNEYYEPDSSDGSEAGANNEDGPGYSPNQDENERESGRSSEVRDFPNLFEEMNEPFQATGFDRKVPWYTAFGNHDALIQGNQPRFELFNRLATNCLKITNVRPATADYIRANPNDPAGAFQRVQADIATIAQDPGAFPALTTLVPKDPRRQLLKKSEWIEQHFVTSGAPAGHGFNADNVASGQGNYSFSPRPGLRFIALDTIAENGGDAGNIDDVQFQWLHDQLLAAERATPRELVVLFAHHSIETMDQLPASPFPANPGPDGPGGYNGVNVHYGERSQAEQTPRPCTVPDRATPPPPNETLKCLLLRHPSAIAFVNGHEHNNRIRPFGRGQGQSENQALGGFWEINTASHIDWPQQSRLIDIVDTLDGNLSIFGTILDHGAPPNPGGAPAPSDGQGQAGSALRRMASISRELSFNDPDSENGEDGRPDARGGEGDRNVELRIRNPYAP